MDNNNAVEAAAKQSSISGEIVEVAGDMGYLVDEVLWLDGYLDQAQTSADTVDVWGEDWRIRLRRA